MKPIFFFLKSVSNCTQMKNSSSSFLCILPLWSFWILRFRSVVTAFFGGTAASISTHIMWSFTSQFVVFQNQRDKTWHFWWGRVGGGIVHNTLPCCNRIQCIPSGSIFSYVYLVYIQFISRDGYKKMVLNKNVRKCQLAFHLF